MAILSGPQREEVKRFFEGVEQLQFLSLLHDLCSGIPEPPPAIGRPRIPLSDAIFAACFKVYSTFSGRRFMSDLRDAQSKEHLRVVPHYNSIFRTLENPDLTPILRGLIIESSLPLKVVEADFAADSSGFTTSRFIRWFDHKYGVVRQQHEWVKVHLMCGVKTNVVTAVEIRDKDASDTKLLPDLVNTTAAHFDMREVSADKGYSSVNNTNVIAEHGRPRILRSNPSTAARRVGYGRRCFITSPLIAKSSWRTITSGRMWKAPSA
jgi:hypothetical protein